jgi:Raf kinase inhibitor-like YbhB/YbcL family protein
MARPLVTSRCMSRIRFRRVVALVAVAAVAASACGDDADEAPGATPPLGDAAADGTAPADGGPTEGGGGTNGGANDAAAAADATADARPNDDAAVGTITVTSSAFANGAAIPAAHTCSGANASPPLAWTGAPAGTQSFAVVMRDLTLTGQGNYHWVIYDIPAASTSLAEGIAAVAAPSSPAGAKQTYWSFGSSYSYLGPCPPVGGGAHDYEFSVYAFATATIPVPAGTTAPAAADAIIQQEKTASGSLTGTYER